LNKTYNIIYDLSEYEELGFLPSAFVANCNQAGMMTYVAHKVHAQTIEDYELKLTPERADLFRLIDSLQVNVIEEKYNTKGKRKKKIEKLLEDKDVKKSIIKYIHRELGKFLQLIYDNKFLLSLNTGRKDYIPAQQIKAGESVLTPRLFFKKTDKDILYKLSFLSNRTAWRIQQRDITVLTNEPAWIVSDRVLHSLSAINGNMVKPFLKKDEVRIPGHYMREYFEKFIRRVAARADIQAEGFDVETNNQLNVCEVTFSENYLTKKSGIDLTFVYGDLRFKLGESTQQKTHLEFDDDDNIIIYQYRRDSEAEQRFVDKLNEFSLEKDYNLFIPTEIEDTFNSDKVMQWIVEKSPDLERLGFKVVDPQMGEHRVALHVPRVELNLKKERDWFDLYGNVVVGEFTFPFIKLASYIGSDNRFYPLPDGRFFLIPEEWMAQYEEIFRMGKLEGEGVRVMKSRFSVLQNLDLEKQDKKSKTALTSNYKRIRYQQPDTLKATLRPYQLEGVKWLIHLYKSDLGGCLADDMGLGKTLQTIAVLLYAKSEKTKQNKPRKAIKQAVQASLFDTLPANGATTPLNALIVLPASLVFNWKSEINQFAPSLSVYGHVGVKRYKSSAKLIGFDVVLTTYHTALKDVEMLKNINFEYIILDESQQIKNRESKIFGAVSELEANHKVSLSGTPIENSLLDLWSQMQFINPELLGTFPFFKKEFLRPIEKAQNEEKQEQLKRLIAPYLLRRTKESVAKDLPELTQQVFYSEMTAPQKKAYETEKSTARNFILENIEQGNTKFNMVVLKTLLRLRQIANHPGLYMEDYTKDSGKFNDILHHLNVIRKGGHKVLIFSQFVSYLKMFKAEFEKNKWSHSILTGDMTSDKREAQIKQFKEREDVHFFLISLKAGGTGLNLTQADYVFIADPWWNPAAEQQAIARAHRIGQTRNVIAIKFITKDSIEEKILKLQQRKTKLAEDIIENHDKLKFEREDLEFLLE